ncbi:MAG: hypothetical protein JWN11_2177 [Hyphomicrobiales bacterium]|nr:hypothetical protein [Hyphomicrobiales bacterium]
MVFSMPSPSIAQKPGTVTFMRKRFRWVDKGIDRFGYWVGAYSIIAGFLSWISSQLTWAKGLGWADYLAIGLLGATVVAIVGAAGLASWRYFRPLPVSAMHVQELASSVPAANGLETHTLSPEPTTTAKIPVQITAYEAERKMRVIDAALDLLKEGAPIIEMGAALHTAPWFQFRMDSERRYPGLVFDYQETLRRYAEKVDEIRNNNQEHQDVMSALQQDYYNAAMKRIYDYANACKAVSDVAGDGSKEPLLGLLNPTRDGFEAAIGELTSWRNKARGDLIDIRKKLALV